MSRPCPRACRRSRFGLLGQLFEERRHLDRRRRRVPSLVPVLATRAIQRLLERLRRQDAEGDRYAGRLGGLAEPGASPAPPCPAAELEWRCPPRDPGAGPDRGVGCPGPREPPRRER